jgi:hypothetical protein
MSGRQPAVPPPGTPIRSGTGPCPAANAAHAAPSTPSASHPKAGDLAEFVSNAGGEVLVEQDLQLGHCASYDPREDVSSNLR